MTRRLVLVRHAQTAWNAEQRAQGHTDISLDQTGRAQAAAAAPRLAAMRPAYVRSSDLSRARETAEAIAGAAGLEVQVDPRLREYAVGARSGLTLGEFEATYPAEYAAWLAHDESLLVDGEETTEQVRARVLPALQECLEALAPGETGLVVMHGACLKVGLLAILGVPYELSRAFRAMENCAWAVLGEHHLRERMLLVSYNETATGAEHPTLALGADFASDDAVG